MSFAVIVAGGQGLRMGTSIAKQFLMLNGKPVLAHTLQAFHQSGLFRAVALVLPPQNMDEHVSFITSYGEMGPMTYVPGGATRQDSVLNGLKALKPFACAAPDEIVCVHDAVRPLIDTAQILDCLNAAKRFGAAVLGVPVTETVKRCDKEGRVLETVPRETLWLAKTPQAVRYSLLWRAYGIAAANGFNATDEAGLLEAAGIPVHMVKGSPTNIKVTVPEDLQMAARLLQ